MNESDYCSILWENRQYVKIISDINQNIDVMIGITALAVGMMFFFLILWLRERKIKLQNIGVVNNRDLQPTGKGH